MALVFVTGAIFAQTVTVECYEQDIIKSPDCTVCNNPNDYELFTGLIVQTIDAGDTVRKKLVYPYKIKIRLDDVLITDKEAHSVFFDFSMTTQFADSASFINWLKMCHFSDTSTGSGGGSYSWYANGGNDIHPSTEIAAGATVNFTGLNGVVVGLPSSGSNTLNFNGSLLQWYLDADSGTAGLVGDAGSQETVNILGGTGISTAISGLNVTITNTSLNTDAQTLNYSGSAGGPVTLDISGSSDDVTLTAGTNITFNRVGDDLTISSATPAVTDLHWLGSGPYTLQSTTGNDVTVSQAGTVTLTRVADNLQISAADQYVGTVTSVGIVDPSEGFTSSGDPITTSGNITFALSHDLAGLEGLSGTGFAVRTGTSTWVTRSFVAGTGISLSNTDGVSGNITITNTVTDTDDQGLDFFNSTSPVTLYADGSADGVMFAAGTGISLAMASDILTITSTVTGATPGGNQYDIQYNDPLGTFAGSDNFEFNGTDVTWTGKLLNTSFNTGSFEFQIGSLYIQEYSLNNSLIGDNTYFNGSSYTRSVPGYASAVQLYNGQTLFFGSNTGTGNYTISYSGKTDYTGKFGFGQGVNSALGNYTGSTFYHDPATLFTGIGTITSTSLITGDDIFRVVSGSDEFAYNTFSGQGFAYLSNGTITGFLGHLSTPDGFVIGGYSNHDVVIRSNNTNRIIVDAAGNVSIGNNASPSQELHVTGDVRVTGGIYDSNNDPGTSGQVLSSTVTGTDWIAAVVNTDAQTLSVSGGTSPVLNISGASSPISFAFTGGTFTSTSSSVTFIANDQSSTNELQTVANTGTGELITTLSNTGGSWNIKLSTGLSGVRTGTALDGIFTISNTVVDTDTDDQGLTYTGSAGGPVTLAIDGGSDVTLTAGSNITFNRVGTDLEISATGAGTYSWDIGVNGGSYTTIGDAEQVSINGAGINVATILGNVITITGTEVDGSTTNEIQNLTFTGAGPFTLAIDGGGTDVTFEDAGILVISRVSNELTFTATEVDGSTTNELDTWDLGANASYTTISTTEQVNFIGAGIAVSSRSGNTITYTATEVDGSTTNELQDLGFSGASSPVTLTITGGASVSFVAGTNTTLSQSAGALTINSTGGATDLTFTGSGPFNLLSSTGTDVTITEGLNIDITRTSNDLSFKATPAGSDTYIQYNSSGSFAASADYVRNVTATIPGIVNRNYYVVEFPLNSGLGLVAKDQGSTDYLMQIGFNAQAQYGGTINTVSGNQIFIYNFQEALGDPSSYYWGFNNTGDNYWGSSSTTWSVKIQQPILSNIPLSIQGASGQTADLLNITTSGGSAGNVMTILPSGFVGLNQVTPTQQFHVVGNARITGAIYDSNNDPGTSGQLLSSTVTGSDWVTASFTDAQNLTFTGSGPFTLDISGGTDVTVSEGNNIDITRATNNLAFAAIPSGSTTHVQYNSSGVFAGNSGFTYDGTNVGWTGMMNNTSFNTTNEELQLGSGYFQAYSLNNFWIGENTIYNGSALTRPATGYASTLQLYNGQFIYYGVSSGSGTYTQNNASKIDYLGRFAIGQSIPSDFADFTNSTFYHESSSSRTGLGTISPSQTIHVVGNARVTGAYYDSNNSPGSSGEVLSSTATGTDWINISAGATDLTFTGSGPFNLLSSTGTDVTFTEGANLNITRATNDLAFNAYPSGSSGEIQYNASGVFAADNSFLWDATNNRLAINQTSNGPGILNLTINTDDYTNTANANTVFNVTNTHASGQIVSTYTINGSLSGKTRFDNAGNLTWASYSAANDRGHYFFNGGDYPSGEANMKITRTGVVVSAVDITAETPGYAMDVRGNLSVTGTVHDASGDAGTSGQLFSSTATGTNWIASPSLTATGSGPFTIDISGGSDVTITEGSNIDISRSSNDLTFNAIPASGNTYIQYNGMGLFASEAAFNYNASTNTMTSDKVILGQYAGIGGVGAVLYINNDGQIVATMAGAEGSWNRYNSTLEIFQGDFGILYNSSTTYTNQYVPVYSGQGSTTGVIQGISGGIRNSISSSIDVDDDDVYIQVTGTITVGIPASTPNRVIYFSNTGGSTVTLDPASTGTIDGAGTYSLLAGNSVMLLCHSESAGVSTYWTFFR